MKQTLSHRGQGVTKTWLGVGYGSAMTRDSQGHASST